MIKKYLLGMLCLLTCFSVQAQQTTFSYASGATNTTLWGTGKKEVVDIAMYCAPTYLVGTSLTSIQVRLLNTSHVKNVKLWLSKKLNLEKSGSVNLNAPDVAQVEATLTDNGREMVASATLPTPYVLTAEGIYVGCTYEVDAIDTESTSPVVCSNLKNAKSFYVHSTRRYLKWADISDTKPSPCISASFTGVGSNRVAISTDSIIYAKTGEECSVPVTIVNYGSSEVSSVGIYGTFNGKTMTKTYDLTEKLPAVYGAKVTINVPLSTIDEDGSYPASFTLSRVNNQANSLSDAQTDFSVDYRQFIPTHRPLVEEYTGAWCGNCPRGYVALKAMKRLYGDDFVAVAYHRFDVMQPEFFDYPNVVTALPAATLNRGDVIDPYYGSDESVNKMNMEQEWLAARNAYAPLSVAVSAHLSEDGTQVEAQSTVVSPRDVSQANYAVEYVLVADSLHGEGSDWCQENYYSSASVDEFTEPEFQLFIGKEAKVKGLKYDDVVVASTRVTNTDAQLPATLKAYADNVSTGTLDIFELLNENKQQIVQSRKNLRVIAIVKDATANNKIVNCAECKVDTATYFTEGIQHVSINGNATADNAAYDLSGRRVANPTKGFYIVNGKKVVK